MFEPVTIRQFMTVDEYLVMEETSPTRHEYLRGVVFARPQVIARHAMIQSNLIGLLGTASQDTPYYVYGSAMRLRAADDVCYYPDLTVVSGHHEGDERFTTRPCLVVEITCSDTLETDRREKLLTYTRMPSMEVYLIVYQDERRIIRHWRDSRGVWWQEEAREDSVILLPCPEMTLFVAQVYGKAFEGKGETVATQGNHNGPATLHP